MKKSKKIVAILLSFLLVFNIVQHKEIEAEASALVFGTVTLGLVTMLVGAGIVLTNDDFTLNDLGEMVLVKEDYYSDYLESQVLENGEEFGGLIGSYNSFKDYLVDAVLAGSLTVSAFIVALNSDLNESYVSGATLPSFMTDDTYANYLGVNYLFETAVGEFYADREVSIPSDYDVLRAYQSTYYSTDYVMSTSNNYSVDVIKNSADSVLLLQTSILSWYYYGYDTVNNIVSRNFLEVTTYTSTGETTYTPSSNFRIIGDRTADLVPSHQSMTYLNLSNRDIYYYYGSIGDLINNGDGTYSFEDGVYFNSDSKYIVSDYADSGYVSPDISPTYEPLAESTVANVPNSVDVLTNDQVASYLDDMDNASSDEDKKDVAYTYQNTVINNYEDSSGDSTGDSDLPELDTSGIIAMLTSIFALIEAFFSGFFDTLMLRLGDLIGTIPATLLNIWQAIIDIPANVVNALGDLVDSVPALVANIADTVSTIPADIASYFGELIDTVPATLLDILDTIISIPSTIIDGIGDFVGSIPDILTNILDLVFSIPQTLIDLLQALLILLFVPSEDTIQLAIDLVYEKLPVIEQVQTFADDFQSALSGNGMELDFVVDMSKAEGTLIDWGDSKVNVLNVSYFARYKDLTDSIIIGVAWLVFGWNVYGYLPQIISASASLHLASARSSRNSSAGGKKEGE